MVEGPFNVNSTSVEAWKVFLSSLKGKPVAYLDKDTALTGGLKLDEATPDGTPVGAFSLPNGKPTSGSTNDPVRSRPMDQLAGTHRHRDRGTRHRDGQAGQAARPLPLALGIRQPPARLRQPGTLRQRRAPGRARRRQRLDQRRFPQHKSAVQPGGKATHDARRSRRRSKAPSPMAARAYVDQADILRNFAAQLTPRGDTFVIRTYGDSLDAHRQGRGPRLV